MSALGKRKLGEGEEAETATHIQNPKTRRMCKKDGALGKEILADIKLQAQVAENEELKKKLKTAESQKNRYMLDAGLDQQDLEILQRTINGGKIIKVKGENCTLQCHAVPVGFSLGYEGVAPGKWGKCDAVPSSVVYAKHVSKESKDGNFRELEIFTENELRDEAETSSSRPQRLQRSGMTNDFKGISLADVKEEKDCSDSD
jgi:hypothetical protein